MSEFEPGSVNGLHVFETGEVAEIYENVARRAILSDDSWEPIPGSERTPINEIPHVIRDSEGRTEYSDGEVLRYEGLIPFYLE